MANLLETPHHHLINFLQIRDIAFRIQTEGIAVEFVLADVISAMPMTRSSMSCNAAEEASPEDDAMATWGSIKEGLQHATAALNIQNF